MISESENVRIVCTALFSVEAQLCYTPHFLRITQRNLLACHIWIWGRIAVCKRSFFKGVLSFLKPFCSGFLSFFKGLFKGFLSLFKGLFKGFLSVLRDSYPFFRAFLRDSHPFLRRNNVGTAVRQEATHCTSSAVPELQMTFPCPQTAF